MSTQSFIINYSSLIITHSSLIQRFGNGGLIGFAWAFRHPKNVDRIFGIYPVNHHGRKMLDKKEVSLN